MAVHRRFGSKHGTSDRVVLAEPEAAAAPSATAVGMGDVEGTPVRAAASERAPRRGIEGHEVLRVLLALFKFGPFIGLLGLVIALSLLSPVFATTRNAGNVLAQTAVIAILSLGQLLVILTRGIDLSVGSALALSSVVGALVFAAIPSGPLVVLAILATGLGVGLVNGVVYVRGRLPHPFVITLAMLSVARGLALWLSGGQPIQGMPDIVNLIGGTSIGWLPISAFVVVALALLIAGLLTRIVWGRWIMAVGGNPDAARRQGIPVDGVLISVYALSGLAAGIAGLITSGRLNGGSPTFGQLAELDSIAAVVIGGASFLGGRGTVSNALIGAFTIGVIRNGMNLLNVDAFLQPIVIGVVIVLAVESDVLRGRLEERFRVAEAARS